MFYYNILRLLIIIDNMTDRKVKSLTDKLYLIDRKTDRNYVIMGSTGNVYEVNFVSMSDGKNSVKCTCPDNKYRSKRCKHIYFVLLRIVNVTNVDSYYYMDDQIMNIRDITKDNVLVSEDIKKKYENSLVQNVRGLDDICPICFEDMTTDDDYVHCVSGCKRCVHRMCFSMWERANGPKCVFCRAVMGGNNGGTYVNLQ